jgi:hypothetical protein
MQLQANCNESSRQLQAIFNESSRQLQAISETLQSYSTVRELATPPQNPGSSRHLGAVLLTEENR